MDESNDDLEREFGSGSQPEHLLDGCWCRHPTGVHHWDPVRDYRELMCNVCKAKATGTETTDEA